MPGLEGFFATVFIAGPPALGLDARPGTLAPRAVRKSVAAYAESAPGKTDPDRLLLLEGIALLWHDCWEPAYEIAQAKEGNPDFDFLHALVHRREGDYANSGYWFRAAGKHPCYPVVERRLAALAAPSAENAGSAARIPAGEGPWSDQAFLERVRKHARETGEAKGQLILIQAEEFRAFAEWLLTPA